MQQKQKTKVRFTSLDIAAMVAELKSKLLGCRITNIYDLSPSTYLFKMSRGDDKHYLICENGMRFHTTETKAEKNKMPSGFTMKFRKYLRSKRLEAIRQVGMERVVVLTFGSESFSNHLILELYSQGNIILTDQNYRIIQCMRSHQFTDKVKTAVGELYPFEYAANIYLEKIDVSQEKVKEVLKEAENATNVEQPQEEQKEGKKAGKSKKTQKKQVGIKLKDMIFKLIPCLFPQVIDNILTRGGFQPNEKCTQDNVQATCKSAAQALEWTKSFQKESHKGYLLISQEKPKEETKTKEKDEQAQTGKEQPKEKYTDYAPYLHIAFENKPHRVFDSFSKAVDLYYENFKKPQEGEDLEELAWRKYEQIKKDQQSRVDKLRSEQEQCQLKAELIEKNIEDVDAVIKILKTMLDNGYSWSQITKMLHQAKKSGDPLANMVHQTNLEKGTVDILLGDTADEQQLTDLVPVEVRIEYNAYTNATQYYQNRKKNYQKEVRTKEASNQVLKVAEREAIKDLEKRKNQRLGNVISTRKPYWFEKFYWFITSQNYLVISGRDSHQNEMIVKKYMRAGDLYMHSDYGGAASTVIKNPTKEPIPRISLEESAIFTVCRSKAWDTKIISGAWWVYNDQVSKSAPTGEYLPTGSFIIRGKKNFVYPNKMEMGITLLYHIGLESVGRHVAQKSEQLGEIAKLDSQKSEIEEAHQEKLNIEEYSIVNLESAKPKQPQQQKQQPKKGQTKQQQATKKEQSKPQPKKDNSQDSDDDVSQEDTQQQSKNAPNKPKQKQAAGKKQQEQQPQQPKHQNRNKKKLQKLKKYMQEQDEEEREMVMKMLGAKQMKHMRDDEVEQQTKGKKDRKSKKQRFTLVKKDQEEVIDKEKVLFLQEEIKTENKFFKTKEKEGRKSKEQANKPQRQQKKPKVKDLVADSGEHPKEEKTQQQKKVNQNIAQQKQPKLPQKQLQQSKKEAQSTQEKLETIQSTQKPEQTQQQAQQTELKQSKPPNVSEQKAKESEQKAKQGKSAQESSSSGSDDQEEKQGQKKDQNYDQDENVLNSDINELSRLVGKVYPQDSYDCLITMCAPYPTITENRFKIKLTPGSLKKGKAARNILHYFNTLELSEHEKQLLKTFPEQQVINALLGNVKLGAAGMLKLELKEKAEKKEKRREKDKQKEKK